MFVLLQLIKSFVEKVTTDVIAVKQKMFPCKMLALCIRCDRGSKWKMFLYIDKKYYGTIKKTCYC